MKVGFIGFGEAGFELSKGLKKEGLQGIVAYDRLIEESTSNDILLERIKAAQVQLVSHPKDIFKVADIIFVAVPPQYALEVCHENKDYITSRNIYVDLSASPPNIKKEIDRIVKKYNANFVDGAMLGPLTVHQHKVPIMASGNGTREWIEQMTPFGMNIQYISDKAGDASSIKLLRSIYMKGTAALLLELLETAKYMNLEQPVIDSIKKTMEESTFEKMLNQLITGTSIHAARRAYELDGALEMLTNSKLNSEMTSAAKKKLEYVSRLNIQQEWGGKRPKDWQTVINKILEINKVDVCFGENK